MIGTLLNVGAILLGSALGVWFGGRLTERIRETCFAILGLITMVIGFQMALKSEQTLIVMGSLLIGGGLGEWWRIEDQIHSFGKWLETRFITGENTLNLGQGGIISAPSSNSHGAQSSKIVRGFLTSTLLFVIGPLAILGSIQDGLSGDYSTLAVKAVMDGLASLAFASSLGIGVIFSGLVVLVYQGSISLLASQAQVFITQPMMTEMTAVGGILLIGIAISSLLEIKPVRVGNLLPSLVIAPLIVAILHALGFG